MDLISLIIILAVVGCVWYLLTTFVPMPAPMKTVITVIAVIALCILLLDVSGVGNIRLGSRL